MNILKCFLPALLLWSLQLSGQELTLDSCIQKAEALSPLTKQKLYLETKETLSIKNIGSSNLPSIYLNGQASYQSDVFSFPNNPLFESPVIPKDQYKATIDVYQNIYDGGITKNRKLIEKANYNSELAGLEVDLYNIKSSVIQLYFSSLLLQENISILNTVLKELNDQYLIIKSRAQNGVILISAADSFKKQILEIEQQILSAQLDREAVLIMLGKWIGQPIDSTAKLNVPEVDITPATELNRPELRLFDQQHLYLETMKGLSNAKRRPVVSAFAQAGVGQPNAFNLLETDFSDFYIVGVKLQWKLLDFGNAKREKGIYTANQEIVKTKKQDLENNLDRMLDKEKADIKKLNLLIEKDKELVALQNNIVRRSFTQLENGVITPQDYLSELNSRTQLELTNQIHKVQLQQAQINYLTISGNL